MNNMKMMTAAEMEKVNGGRYYLHNAPMGIRQELTSRRSRLLDQVDLFADDGCIWRQPENPDMIIPDFPRRSSNRSSGKPTGCNEAVPEPIQEAPVPKRGFLNTGDHIDGKAWNEPPRCFPERT